MKIQKLLVQRYSIRFHVKLNKTDTQTFPINSQVYEDIGSQKVSHDRAEVEDVERAGRLSKSRSDENREKIWID